MTFQEVKRLINTIMKTFKQFIKESSQGFIVKSWYHPETDNEVIVDTMNAKSYTSTLDSHSNHLFNNTHLYGFKNTEEILTKAGHDPKDAMKIVDDIKKEHKSEGGYVDWHDDMVHAMHKHGWARIVKFAGDYDGDDPPASIYSGSHDINLSKRAANQLAAKEPHIKTVNAEAYERVSVLRNKFSAEGKIKAEENYEINSEGTKK
jgi:hypothetical protein